MARKILLTSAVLLLALTGSLFAEDTYDLADLGASIVPYVQLDIMCSLESFQEDDGLAEMMLYSSELDPYYKDILFEKYSQNPWGVAAVNFCTGGMGSLINGNVLSGTVLQAGFVGSYTFMVLGLMEQDPVKRNTDFIIAEIGAAVFGIAGLVLPFIEVSAYNKSLKQGLNM